MRKIAITGFMCSGKTTVADAIGKLFGVAAADLDEAIVRSMHRTPTNIIEQDGEEAFREIETRELADLLSAETALVIALGGGTWTVEKNRTLLSTHGYLTVWLDAPLELCWKRIQASGVLRPLARSYEAAKERYEKRLSVYELADYRVAVNGEDTPAQIANTVAALVLRGRANS